MPKLYRQNINGIFIDIWRGTHFNGGYILSCFRHLCIIYRDATDFYAAPAELQYKWRQTKWMQLH